jgi:uncharacterized integral membrane protein
VYSIFFGHPSTQMQKIRWFLLIVVIVLALVVVLQNNHDAEVHLLLHKRSIPLSVLLFSTTAVGFLFGALMTATMLRSRGAAAEKKAKKPAQPSPSEASSRDSTESRPLG